MPEQPKAMNAEASHVVVIGAGWAGWGGSQSSL